MKLQNICSTHFVPLDVTTFRVGERKKGARARSPAHIFRVYLKIARLHEGSGTKKKEYLIIFSREGV